MSGYFARLASLAPPPTASARQARAAPLPRPLESDNEIDTTPVAATATASVGAFERIHTQEHTTSISVPPQAAATPAVPAWVPIAQAASSALESKLPVTQMPVAPIKPMRLNDTTITNQTRQAAPTTFSDVESLAVIRESASSDLAPLIDDRSSPEPRAPFAPLGLLARADTTNRPGTSSLLASAVPRPDASASADMTEQHLDGQAGNDSPAHHGAMVRPDVPISRSGSFSAHTPAGAAKAAARVEVRIGTIALEVRVAPPSPVVAAPVAAAKAPVTPPQFSPHRHYLRWS